MADTPYYLDPFACIVGCHFGEETPGGILYFGIALEVGITLVEISPTVLGVDTFYAPVNTTNPLYMGRYWQQLDDGPTQYFSLYGPLTVGGIPAPDPYTIPSGYAPAVASPDYSVAGYLWTVSNILIIDNSEDPPLYDTMGPFTRDVSGITITHPTLGTVGPFLYPSGDWMYFDLTGQGGPPGGLSNLI